MTWLAKICLALTAVVVFSSSDQQLKLDDDASTRGVNFEIQVCTSNGNCQPEPAGMVIDYHYIGCLNGDPSQCSYVIKTTVALLIVACWLN